MATLALGQSNDNVLVTLDRWDDGQVQVWNIELLGEGVRNRVSFSEGRMVDEVFVPELAARVQELLSSLDRHTRIYSDSDFELQVPGASLRGLRVMIAQAKENFDRVLLRFREVSGPISNLFCVSGPTATNTVTAAERVAVATLSDIVLPICDLADGLREMAGNPGFPDKVSTELLEERLATLSEQSESVRLYMHLLMRYIESGGQPDDASDLQMALAGLTVGG